MGNRATKEGEGIRKKGVKRLAYETKDLFLSLTDGGRGGGLCVAGTLGV